MRNQLNPFLKDQTDHVDSKLQFGGQKISKNPSLINGLCHLNIRPAIKKRHLIFIFNVFVFKCSISNSPEQCLHYDQNVFKKFPVEISSLYKTISNFWIHSQYELKDNNSFAMSKKTLTSFVIQSSMQHQHGLISILKEHSNSIASFNFRIVSEIS